MPNLVRYRTRADRPGIDNQSSPVARSLLSAAPRLFTEPERGALLKRFADTVVAASEAICAACIWAGNGAVRDMRSDYVTARSRRWEMLLTRSSQPPPGRRAASRALAHGQLTVQRIVGRAFLRRNPFARRRRASVLAVPFPAKGTDAHRAVVLLYAEHTKYFSEDVRKMIADYAALADTALIRVTTGTRPQEQGEQPSPSQQDEVTVLPDQRFLRQQLQRVLSAAMHTDPPIALAVLDLVDFRAVNDRFGHAEGDSVLYKTARRLQQVLAPETLLARLGGNEFAILFPRIEGTDALKTTLRNCLSAAGKNHSIGGEVISLSACIGATVASGRRATTTPEELMREASVALGQAKRDEGNPLHFYEPAADKNAAIDHAVAGAIRTALLGNRFILHYQPQLDTTRAVPIVTGVEALIRMDTGSGRVRGPGEFIPVAEKSTLIEEIGEWVLNEALTQASKWKDSGLELTVGVNIGARHLLSGDFVQQLRTALARHPRYPPAGLEIEITESAALADLEQARRTLAACRQLGVGVTVDDFGTGYASLTYVQSLPVTRIKVDQHFVRRLPTEPRDMAVIAGTVTSSRLLNIDIVAEGVETILHGLTLMRLGCDILQGYALSAPLPDSSFRTWLREWKTPPSWQAWAGHRTRTTILPLLSEEISHRREAGLLVGQNLPPPGRTLGECSLTQWLRAEERGHFPDPRVLQSLEVAHQQFHRSAAALRTARCGANESRVQTERHTFVRSSERLISCLVKAQELLCADSSAAK